MRETHRRHRLSKVALIVGFAALLVGVLLAHGDPARGYELSLLAATPTGYWVGLGTALVVAVLVGLSAGPGTATRLASLVLAGVAILTVVGLPLLRGYYFYGAGDSLTHLGWTRDLAAGVLTPTELLYPGIHLITLFVSDVMGIRLTSAQLYMTLAFTAVFLLFVPLCVRLVSSHPLAVPVAAFAAVLLVPNNNVSVHLMAHPITQSILFLPFAFYLMFRYALWPGPNVYGFGKMTPVGALLGLAAVAAVLLHPQGALNVIFIFAAVAGLQFLVRRYRPMSRIARHRPMYAPTVLFVAAFVLWAPRHERVQRSVESVLTGLLSGAEPAGEITSRAISLDALGGSILELFVKLFLPTLVFGLLAGISLLAVLRNRLGPEDPDRQAVVAYLAAASLPLVAGFAVFFAASITTQHYRYIGFTAVPLTLLGVFGLTDGLADGWSVSRRGVAVATVVVLAVTMPLAVATVHASPFIYQPSSGGTQLQMDGYQNSFEDRSPDVAYTGIRTGPRRAIHAIYGTETAQQLDIPGARDSVNGTAFDDNLSSHYDEPRYIPVTDGDVKREVRLYDGYRYSREGFRSLDRNPEIDRVVANSEYRLYLLDSDGEGT